MRRPQGLMRDRSASAIKSLPCVVVEEQVETKDDITMKMEYTFTMERLRFIMRRIESNFFYRLHAIVCTRKSILACTAFLFVIACGNYERKRAWIISPAAAVEIDRFISDVHSTYPIPGLAVSIVHREGSYKHVEGMANSSTILSDTTIFFSGNISELMVATAVLRLVDEGKILLDDPIVKHLPYFKLEGNTYDEITIRHMLTHSSGIPHHSVIYDPPSFDDYALEATTRSIEHQEPDFKAGSQIKRSPYNYDILADLIAKVTGEKFEIYLTKSVFSPLGMTRSTFSYLDIPSKGMARPHLIGDWLAYTVTEAPLYPYSREHAGSRGFHTTLQDISRWMEMILDRGNVKGEQFLSEPMMKEFMKRCYKTDEKNFTGVGWEIEEVFGTAVFRKGDNAYGFSTSLMLIPERSFGLITVSNVSGDFNPAFINAAVSKFAMGETLNRVKIPAGIAFSRKLALTNNLDSAFKVYHEGKKHPDIYTVSEEELSQPGVNLLYRLHRPADAIRVFEYCLKEFPRSPSAYLNLAEAYLLNNNSRKAGEAVLQAKALRSDDADVLARIAFLEDRLKVSEEKESLVSSTHP